ncbi:MAG: hypothetical protein NTX32_00410 [Candidatus Firestonebacteria bacterium]|nr:hypothetical protein [Candidatus Firestonebacteria bacterium]
MTKQKGSRSKASNIFYLLFIIAAVTVLFLLGQVEIKEKEIKILKEKQVAEKSKTTGAAAQIRKENSAVLTKELEAVARKEIIENIEALVGRKPKIAGGWFLSDIKFTDNGIVTIFAEDGHEAEVVSLAIVKPSDFRTWRRVKKTE